MKTTEETITPAQAQAWLRRTESTTQRAISEKAVARLAAAIREGRWKLTHQGIAITDDEVVIDGRHRLSAIVRADMAVPLLVTRGADPGTFLAVDTGRARTPGDLLHIAGFHNTPTLAAAVRYIIAAKRIRGTQNSWVATINPIRHDEIVDFTQMNEREVEHAIAIGNRIARSLGRYGLRTWMSAAVYLIRESSVPPDLQNEFFERLSDGAMLQPGSPILALRRYVTQSFLHQANAVKGPVGLGVTIKAFNAYVTGGTVQIAVFKLGVERFPGVKPWQPNVTEIEEHVALPVEKIEPELEPEPEPELEPEPEPVGGAR